LQRFLNSDRTTPEHIFAPESLDISSENRNKNGSDIDFLLGGSSFVKISEEMNPDFCNNLSLASGQQRRLSNTTARRRGEEHSLNGEGEIPDDRPGKVPAADYLISRKSGQVLSPDNVSFNPVRSNESRGVLCESNDALVSNIYDSPCIPYNSSSRFSQDATPDRRPSRSEFEQWNRDESQDNEPQLRSVGGHLKSKEAHQEGGQQDLYVNSSAAQDHNYASQSQGKHI